jgi:cytochrome-b5 reductase
MSFLDLSPALLLPLFIFGSALLLVMAVYLARPKNFLDGTRQSLTLSEIKVLSPDTKLFRFALPTAGHRFGLPLGKHVKIFCPNPTGVIAGKWNGRDDPEEGAEEIQRSYTPTSSEADPGRADLVIKMYEGGKIDRFPDGGKMSQYFGSLKVGDSVALQGPTGSIHYLGRGNWKYAKREIKAITHVGMMAGGTGITPMYQIVQEALRDASDTTTFSLLFANQTKEDILLYDELNELAKSDRFWVHYTLDRPPKKWEGSTGFITAEMISAHLPAPSASTLVVMCGPPPMVKFACKQNLDALGYEKKRQLAF